MSDSARRRDRGPDRVPPATADPRPEATTYVSRGPLAGAASAGAARVRTALGRTSAPGGGRAHHRPLSTAAPRTPSTRPATRAPTRAVRPYGVASAIAAGWAAGIGLLVVGVPVLLVWAFAAHADGGTEGAVHAAAAIWLAAHHVPLELADGPLGLLPLGLLLVPAGLLRLSGGWATRMLTPGGLADAALLVVAVATLYGLLGGLVATLAGGPADARPLSAVVGCAVVAAAVLSWTVVRVGGLGAEVRAVVPEPLRRAGAAAGAAVLTLVGLSALLVLGSLVAHRSDAGAVWGELGTGVVGGVALLIVCVVYLPNVAVWAAAYAVGPGFSLGAGTSVTVAGATTGPMPAFPLLAAVPSDGSPGALAVLVCALVPVAAGVVAGVLTARQEPGRRAESVAVRAAAAGALGGVLLGVLAWLSAGPLGDERLADVGPAPLSVALVAALELAVVAAVTGWLLAWRAERGHRTS